MPKVLFCVPDEFGCLQTSIYHRVRVADRLVGDPSRRLRACVCGNETAIFQLLVGWLKPGVQVYVLGDELRSDTGVIPKQAWRVCFADFVQTEEHGKVADPLKEEATRPLPLGIVQPAWLFLDVPATTAGGLYRGAIEVGCEGAAPVSFRVEIEVLPVALPDTRSGTFRLNLWQHPAAIARYHRVGLWSEAHWGLLREYTRLLAGARQSNITACIIHDPWASQTPDPHAGMVEWRRVANGVLSFDFTVFDRYVELCLNEGLRGPVDCYSVATGPGDRRDCPIRVLDADTGASGNMKLTMDDPEYARVWDQFFRAFVPHLKAKGWLAETVIAIDEAPEDKLAVMLAVIPPDMKISLASTKHIPELDDRIQDFAVAFPGAPREVNLKRRAGGKAASFYTCAPFSFPNTFCASPPVESRSMPWYALRIGADSYLRWAFTSWPNDPFSEPAFGPWPGVWPAGELFFVYPGPTTSIRFELLKKGISDFEAWQIARNNAPHDTRLDEAVDIATRDPRNLRIEPYRIDRARDLVNDVLRST